MELMKQGMNNETSVAESVQMDMSTGRTYTLRNLCAKDIFPMAKIIRKIGLKDIGGCFSLDEIKATVEPSDKDGAEKNSDDVAETVGITVVLKIVDVVLENLSTAEQEIFNFIAGVAEITADDVANLSMDVFFDMLVDIFKKKEFVGFMKAVLRLFK